MTKFAISAFFSVLILSLSVQAIQIRHEVSTTPAQVTLTFGDQEIKSMNAEELKYRETSLKNMVETNTKIYDTKIEKAVILKSSNSTNLIKSGIDNGLLGSMYVAYANHIPLTVRPDDVWLAITTAFAHYVNTHAEEMRDKFVRHQGQEKLTVSMPGSLAMSDEAFWNTFIAKMLQEMQKTTTSDLRQWLVPQFSTTTPGDRLVGQIVMMGAMKKYYSYNMVLSSALTKLTIKGTLQDWQNVRARAEKLGQFGGELQQWSEALLPVLDQFVEAYKGNVSEDFWQRMITYRRLGSGSQKQFRGWFVAFAPFNSEGKYILNTKKVIDETGVYATLLDSSIYNATVFAPVSLNDNGTEHNLVFWGGVTAPTYDSANNMVQPSVDWAIIDKVKLPQKEAAEKIINDFYGEYKDLSPEYKEIVSEADFTVLKIQQKLKQQKEGDDYRAKREAEEKATKARILGSPKDKMLAELGQIYYYYDYSQIPADYKNVMTVEEFAAAKAQQKMEYEAQENARKEEYKRKLLALTNDRLLFELTNFGGNAESYDKLDPVIKARITKDEYLKAVEERKKLQQISQGWQ